MSRMLSHGTWPGHLMGHDAGRTASVQVPKTKTKTKYLKETSSVVIF